ncbi:MAG: DUF551 domain-containing protein [Clostridia bacterium]|nr:DUF551 domain-containing protein [Clostridia bacterium]
MADLIDRDAVIKQIAETQDKVSSGIEDVTFYRAIKIIRNAPAVNRWIPCSERLPEQEVRVLLFASDEVYLGELTDIKDVFDTDFGFMKNGYVTHWMPRPEPPKEDADDA